MAAHGVADHDHAPPPHGIHHFPQIRGELLGPVLAVGSPATLPVSPLVEGDDVKPVNEGRDDGVEPVSVGGAAVEEAEGGPARLAPLQSMKGDAVNHE